MRFAFGVNAKSGVNQSIYPKIVRGRTRNGPRDAGARAFRFSKECTGTDQTKIFRHAAHGVV